jgi:hypothetical protein
MSFSPTNYPTGTNPGRDRLLRPDRRTFIFSDSVGTSSQRVDP